MWGVADAGVTSAAAVAGVPPVRACARCASRKLRCSGTVPCERCVSQGCSADCYQSEPKKRGRPRKQPQTQTQTSAILSPTSSSEPATSPRTVRRETAAMHHTRHSSDQHACVCCGSASSSPHAAAAASYAQPSSSSSSAASAYAASSSDAAALACLTRGQRHGNLGSPSGHVVPGSRTSTAAASAQSSASASPASGGVGAGVGLSWAAEQELIGQQSFTCIMPHLMAPHDVVSAVHRYVQSNQWDAGFARRMEELDLAAQRVMTGMSLARTPALFHKAVDNARQLTVPRNSAAFTLMLFGLMTMGPMLGVSVRESMESALALVHEKQAMPPEQALQYACRASQRAAPSSLIDDIKVMPVAACCVELWRAGRFQRRVAANAAAARLFGYGDDIERMERGLLYCKAAWLIAHALPVSWDALLPSAFRAPISANTEGSGPSTLQNDIEVVLRTVQGTPFHAMLHVRAQCEDGVPQRLVFFIEPMGTPPASLTSLTSWGTETRGIVSDAPPSAHVGVAAPPLAASGARTASANVALPAYEAPDESWGYAAASVASDAAMPRLSVGAVEQLYGSGSSGGSGSGSSGSGTGGSGSGGGDGDAVRDASAAPSSLSALLGESADSWARLDDLDAAHVDMLDDKYLELPAFPMLPTSQSSVAFVTDTIDTLPLPLSQASLTRVVHDVSPLGWPLSPGRAVAE